MSSLLSSPPPSTRDALDSHEDTILLEAAILWEKSYNDSEHHVARYAILLLREYFLRDWIMVPQFRTQGKMVPDLALERYEERLGSSREKLFVPRVYIEFKLGSNPDSALEQVIDALSQLPGQLLPARGVVIAVQGRRWTIMDYHICKRRDEYILMKSNFYDNTDLSPERPIPSKPYQGKMAPMDIGVAEELLDLRKALHYLGKNPEGKNLLSLAEEATALSNSLSVPSLYLGSDEDDQYQTVETDSPDAEQEDRYSYYSPDEITDHDTDESM